MPILILAIAALGAFFVIKSADSSSPSEPASPPSNSMGLQDVVPSKQGGVFRRDWDDQIFQAAKKNGVPFALMKAHAIRESAMKPQAFRQEPSGKASYGLMQILWWKNSNRFADYGYNDDFIGDGSILYDAFINADIAAQIILDNWNSYHNLRDAVNAYNTGRKESVRIAPGNYVDDVLDYYETLIGQPLNT